LNFSLYIAKRYLVSKSSNNAINIITIIASVGTIVATAALFVVLSGFSGLKDFSLSFFRAADPDIKISASKGKTFLFTDSIASILEKHNELAFYTKILEERAFFNYHNKEHIAFIKGVDQNFLDVMRMDTTLIAGKWLSPDFPYGVVVGNGISNKLSMGIDYLEPLRIYVPKAGENYDTSVQSLVRQIETRNVGIFSIIDDIDSKYVFSYLPVVQELLQYPLNQISAIDIKLKKGTNTNDFAKKLQTKLGNRFKVQTRAQLNAVFYKMLNTENLVLYFIFTLVLIIALFNIIGAIIMMILDKRSNLKTLLNMGAGVKDLKRIFIMQGFLLSLFGLVVGLSLGMLLVYLQDTYQLFMIYYQLAYPVVFKLQNVFLVVITMLVLGYLAARIASSRINEEMLLASTS
jgi:lipoprotein-releasing system permease protein